MKQLIIGLIIGIIIGFALFAYAPIGHRYTFEAYQEAVPGVFAVYKYDNWNGRAWLCTYAPAKSYRTCFEITE